MKAQTCSLVQARAVNHLEMVKRGGHTRRASQFKGDESLLQGFTCRSWIMTLVRAHYTRAARQPRSGSPHLARSYAMEKPICRLKTGLDHDFCSAL